VTIADISADEMRRGGVAGGVSGSGRRLLAAAVKVDRLLTRFTCFTGTKAYWYKYMNVAPEAELDESAGTRFTCFTGTKVHALLVQILTQKERRLSAFFFLSVELDRSQKTVLKRRGNTFFFFGQWS
jgi:hypothetical protein